jgi:surface polysaccharide O-acyltransferase-like enzyme
MSQSKEISWADNLRAISTFCVIILHTSSTILYQYGTISNSYWWTGNIFDSAVRFCVPMFLMLTGVLLLPKDYTLKYFLKNRFLKIILPFAFWSLIYIIYNLRLEIVYEQKMTTEIFFKWFLSQIKLGASPHFWYVYMIIGIYLFIPIISKWIRNSNEKEILYFLLIWAFILFFKEPYIMNFKINIDITYFTGYIGYPVLGYYLSNKVWDKKVKLRTISIVLIVIGILITAHGTYFGSKETGKFYEGFYGYLTPNVLLIAVGVFLFFKNTSITKSPLLSLIRFICKYSYGIYLVHILILTLLNRIGISNILIHPIIAIPATALLCLMFSSGVIYCINKIPFGKFISG